jgi:capsular exopolysaccharide synthesis family protein
MSDIFDALVKAQREVDHRNAGGESQPLAGDSQGTNGHGGARPPVIGDDAGAGRQRARRGRSWFSWLRGRRNGGDDSAQLGLRDERSFLDEQFRVLRTRIEVQIPGTIMITSSLEQEGKTLCATNLAIALSMRFAPGVILVDADLRRSAVASRFGIHRGPGLAECLMGEAEWRDCLVTTRHERLRVIPAGRHTAMACELLGSERMHQVTNELKAEFPHHPIVFDSPPVLLTADALVVARYMDYIVFVIRAGMTPRAAALKAIEALGRDRITGVVFNGATESASDFYYYGRQYGYYGGQNGSSP